MTLDVLPVSVTVGRANEHDSRKLVPLVEGIKRRARVVYADKAYSTFIVRWYLGKRRIRAHYELAIMSYAPSKMGRVFVLRSCDAVVG